MSIFDDIAKELVKKGAPVLGGLIGTAIGGPAGTIAGSLAGKALETVAEALGTAPDPAAVNAAIANDPGAAAKLQAAEAASPEMIRVWQTQATMALEAQQAEISKGFGSWDMRRNVAHYSSWGMFVVSGLATLIGAFIGNTQLAIVSGVFTATTGVVMAWVAVNSGGKAAADAVRAWRGQ